MMLEYDKRDLRVVGGFVGFLIGAGFCFGILIGFFVLVLGGENLDTIGPSGKVLSAAMLGGFGTAGAILGARLTAWVFNITEADETEWVCVGKDRKTGEQYNFSVWALDTEQAEDQAKDVGSRICDRFKLKKTFEVKGGGRPKPSFEDRRQSIYYPGYHCSD